MVSIQSILNKGVGPAWRPGFIVFSSVGGDGLVKSWVVSGITATTLENRISGSLSSD
jgi:hypothetical protein